MISICLIDKVFKHIFHTLPNLSGTWLIKACLLINLIDCSYILFYRQINHSQPDKSTVASFVTNEIPVYLSVALERDAKVNMEWKSSYSLY